MTSNMASFRGAAHSLLDDKECDSGYATFTHLDSRSRPQQTGGHDLLAPA